MKKGFTIIELLIVISITAIIGAATIPLASGFLVRNHLKNKTNELVSAFRTAQLNTIAGKEAVQWGVYLDANEIIMFKGSSYSPPGTAFDHHYDIPGSITPSPDSAEIVFDKLTGNPSSTTTITLTSNAGGDRVVIINEVGTIDVQ